MPTLPSLPGRSAGMALVETAMRRRRWVLWGALLLTVLLGAQIVRIKTDTDPENMLPSDDPVRVRNEQLADEFGIPLRYVGVGQWGVFAPHLVARYRFGGRR